MHLPVPLLVDGDIIFFSNFDSGNLASVNKVGNNQYECYLSPDCEGTIHEMPYTTWFHFCVKGSAKGTTIALTLMNLNVQTALYSQQMAPVYRSVPSMPCFVRIPGRVTHTALKDAGSMQINFNHTFQFDKEEVFFAFTYPYSYTYLQNKLAAWEQSFPILPDPNKEDVLFLRETLAHTVDGRIVDLLTITNFSGRDMGALAAAKHVDGLQAKSRLEEFPTKQFVCLSARVHPGETPSSHILHGAIEFLLSSDPRAHLAREHFVFQIVPMLNPDGVYRGHYRTDTYGVNLNRCYIQPDSAREPAIYAMKALLLHLQQSGRLALYVDLHGHATRRGAFMYGNAVPEERFVDMLLYPKLVSLNTPYFDFAACNFTEKNMVSKGKRDGLSKEGSSRVNLFQETGFVYCYTLEANYNTLLTTNRMTHIDLDMKYPATQADALSHAYPEHFPQSFIGLTPKYIPQMYHDIGRALVISALDMFDLNARSRLPFTYFQSIKGVRSWIERNLKLVMTPPHKVKCQYTQTQARLALQECGAPLRATVHKTDPQEPPPPKTPPKVEKASANSKRRSTGGKSSAHLSVSRRKSAPGTEIQLQPAVKVVELLPECPGSSSRMPSKTGSTFRRAMSLPPGHSSAKDTAINTPPLQLGQLRKPPVKLVALNDQPPTKNGRSISRILEEHDTVPSGAPRRTATANSGISRKPTS